ncbi:MFS transporter [Arthrobacter sp. M4]|uniref:MFS transporter n=1 Tax=Arthrobacter sp. M4 TaxID=218160 RepID=UPI001CDB93C7|nr:MFS transporter [Arthrobacter sp. M4]MCA4133798.1 MFS transporter [Arthrobacter sp. M4]
MSVQSIRQHSPTTLSSASWRDWSALALLMFPVLLVAVDNTALTFALPEIARTLRASGVQLLWIVDAYALVLAALLVSMGNLGDRIGRRRLLLIGSTGFSAVSVAMAFSPTAEWLLAGRAVLGLFGAMLMPSTLSLIRNIFVDAGRRRLAIAIWAASFSGGAALGPILGGWLVAQFWWGAVFLVAVPLLLPLLAAGPSLIPESKDANPGRVDVPSIVLSMLAMAPAVYGIKVAATEGFGLLPAALILFGILMGWAFVRRQLMADSPLLDMALFRNRVFSTSIIANVLSLFSLNGFIFFFAQHLQLVEGRSPMNAGLAMVPALIAMIVAGFVVVPLVRHVRPGAVVSGGLALSASGYLIAGAGDHSGGPVWLLTAMVILAVGVGSAETISNDLILGSVPAGKAGAASAISETGYEVGSLMGTAVLGSLLTASYQHNLALPAGLTQADAGRARETLAGALDVANALPDPARHALEAAARTAFESGVHVTSAIALALMTTAALLCAVKLRQVPVAK